MRATKNQMVKILLGLLILAISSFAAVEAKEIHSKDSDFLADYPQEQDYSLNSGEVIKLPIHYYDAKALALIGTADLIKLNEVLSPQNLHALPLSKKRGLVSIYILDYGDSSLGAYKEMAIVIGATTENYKNGAEEPSWKDIMNGYKSLLGFFAPKIGKMLNVNKDKWGLYVWYIPVTIRLALDAGIELWGLPKVLANIEFECSNSQKTFFLESENCTLSGFMGKDTSKAISFPLNMDVSLISPKEIKPSLAPLVNKGKQKLIGFNDSTDEIDFNNGSPCAQKLKEIIFTPIMWQFIPEFQQVLLLPKSIPN